MDTVLVSDAPQSLRDPGSAGGPPATAAAARLQPFYFLDAVSRPLTEFSGDFYFYSEVAGDLWFALGDFAGHGLPAAIYSAMIQEEIPVAIKACPFADPAEVVASLHGTLRPEFPFNRFASLVIGRMRPDGSLQLANAGHSQPVIRREDGSIEIIDSHGPVVGLLPYSTWKQSEHLLGTNDRLLLHSDGLIESTDANDEEIGSDRVWDWVRSSHHSTLGRELLSRFDRFTGGAQGDDVTLMVLGPIE